MQRHVVAFARAHERRRLICAVPRLCLTLLDRAQPWEGRLTVPAAGAWIHLVTGRTYTPRDGALPLRELFADFPVALLRSAD
jgi:maltooligosyltrehalose synthase